jgi:mannose-6-phosphate isomerase class I
MGRPYEPNPRYAPLSGRVEVGWEAMVADLPDQPVVLALDGPAILDWETSVGGLGEALISRHLALETRDIRFHHLPWDEIRRVTESGELAHDPDFAKLPSVSLADLFEDLPAVSAPLAGVMIVYGPGAALIGADLLWYLDLPKRYAEAAVTAGDAVNLGRPPAAGPATTKRLWYVDWPLLDRHRDGMAARIDRLIDTQDPARPTSLSGAALRATAEDLARRPFRTRPTFNTTIWGGHWAQDQLGFNPEAPNTGLGYELMGPESGVLIGAEAGAEVEVPFQLLVALQPLAVLGPAVHESFGLSFPIRFDYLDTVGGGSLSVHCHPQNDYMRDVFGWPYTQHETYYVMVGGDGTKVYLGLRAGVDIARFHELARGADQCGQAFDIERFVNSFPAEPHRLFLIPAGTPHGSGKGNVVLEVSATPYLYSLRFYDWLRRDALGRQRPVHVEHAFNNLATARTGEAVAADLVQLPRVLREAEGWREELIGRLPDMFFDVRRILLESDAPAPDDTEGRFHVMTVVEGEGVIVEWGEGRLHELAYAETMLIPAAVGPYALHRWGEGRVRLLKSLVT